MNILRETMRYLKEPYHFPKKEFTVVSDLFEDSTLEIKGEFFNLIKSIYFRSNSTITFDDETKDKSSFKSGTRHDFSYHFCLLIWKIQPM